MRLNDKVIIVTGGGRGIGAALCERFSKEQPAGIVVADIDLGAAESVAESVGGLAVQCDVANEESVQQLVQAAEDAYGRVDVFCANAGIADGGGDGILSDDWQRMIDINFMSHVYSSRAVLPGMLKRGSGCLIHTASAAGLLTEMSSASYSVTKHSAVALAEWLAIKYGPRGIHVSCLCPQGVQTQMIEGDHPMSEHLRATSVTAEFVADCVVEALAEERFLVLPHEEVARYMNNRASDHQRWLRGMQRLREKVFGDS